MRTHIVRGLFGSVMLLSLLVAWGQSLAVGAAGLNLFQTICWMNFIVCTLAGISYFATCVTEESEAGNLGLLKLAGLGAFSILLGKSTSRLVGALMLLVVQFPFTLLAITLGGVTLVQIVAAYAAIGSHLILVANLALFFSVYCSSSGRAAAWTAMVVILFYLSKPFATFVATSSLLGGGPNQNSTWLEAWRLSHGEYSVTERFSAALAPAFTGPIITSQFWVYLVLSAVLFFLACVGFDWSTNRQSTASRGMLSRGRRSLSRVFGVSRAWSSPLMWKDFNFLTGGRVMFWLRVIAFTLLAAGLYQFGSRSGEPDWRSISTMLGTCSLAVLGLETLAFSCRLLFDESRWAHFLCCWFCQ